MVSSVLRVLFASVLIFNFINQSFGCYPQMGQNYGTMDADEEFLVNTTHRFQCSFHKNIITHDGVNYTVGCKDLVIRFKNENLDNTRCKDDLTREFDIVNATVNNTGFYSCNAPNLLKNKQNLMICMSTYNFGYKPLEVENFTCISKNFYNLTCSWDEPENPVRTKYELKLHRFYLPSVEGLPCGVKPTRQSCLWSMTTQPIYYQKPKTLHFSMTGVNKFSMWNKHYDINHYSIIWAGVPQDFKLLTQGTNYIYFNWTHPEHMNPLVAPAVTYQIWYKHQFDTNWTVKDLGKEVTNVNLTDLIPNLEYQFGLRCRVLEATNFWSDFTNATVKTLADVPYLSPKIVPQSFRITRMETYRTITLYWQGVEEKNCNAKNCGYEIYVFRTHIERKRRHLNEEPQVIFMPYKTTSVVIQNLSLSTDYDFVIYTKNELGRSKDFASIKIPKSVNLPMEPSNPSAVINNTEYIIKWEHPIDRVKLTSYTVAVCQNGSPRVYDCTGKISWTNVPANETTYRQVLDDNFIYKFAVSANTESASSGLKWIPCVVPLDRVIEKLTAIRGWTKGPYSLTVNWNLECNALRRVVLKYVISYGACKGPCNSHSPEEGDCHFTDEKVISVKNESFTLEPLKPFTSYVVRVAAITRAGTSEFSETTCGYTREAAPSDSPSIVNLANISSNSAVVYWQSPKQPNGEITKYEIFLNGQEIGVKEIHTLKQADIYSYTINKLASYQNYSVQISGCVQNDCSNKSEETMFVTKIGEPGRMATPRATAENTSSVLVSWDPPSLSNGPIDYYLIRWRSEQNPHENNSREFNVSGSLRSTNIDLQCDLVKPKNPTMISIQAVNIVDDQKLIGPPSPPAKIAFCPPVGEVGALTIGLSIGAVLGLLVLIVILYVLVRWMKGKVDTMKKFEVVLPNGLDSPQSNPMSSYENFKNGLLTNPDLSPKPAYGRLDSFVSDDSFKNRHGSGTSQFSASSTDELITKQNIVTEKAKRNPSGDSSGCGSTGGHDSLSSSLTHRTNLSSDSGNEADLKNPPSPEVGREGDPKDIKLEEKPIDASRVNGSKDSGVDKGDDSDEKTKSPVSPYSQISSCTDSNDKATSSFSPQASYSKLGLESSYVPFSRGPHMTLYAHNLANSEPSINAIDGVNPYTVIKAESQTNGKALDPAKAMQYSKFGICKSSQDVTCGNEEGVVLPYSRFGMKKVTPNYVGHELAYTVLTHDPKDVLLKNKQNPWIANMAILSGPENPVVIPGKALRTSPLRKPGVDTNPKEVDNLAYSKFGIGETQYADFKTAELTAPPINVNGSKAGTGYVAFEDAKILPISQMVADAELADDGIEDDFEKSSDLGYNTMLNSDVANSMDNLTNGGIAPYSCFLTSSLKDDVDVTPEPFSLSLADNIHAPPSYDDLKSNISPIKSPLNVNGYLARDVLAPSSSNWVDERTSGDLSHSTNELDKKSELRETKTPKVFMDKNGYVVATELPSICGGKDARLNMPRTDV